MNIISANVLPLIDKQVKRVLVELNKALDLAGINYISKSVPIYEAMGKCEKLARHCSSARAHERLLATLKPSGYPEYPHKKIEEGYVILFDDQYRRRKCEHRYLMELHLNRKLLTNEHVHHIDGNKSNNTIDNLMVVTPQAHRDLHTKQNKIKRIA